MKFRLPGKSASEPATAKVEAKVEPTIKAEPTPPPVSKKKVVKKKVAKKAANNGHAAVSAEKANINQGGLKRLDLTTQRENQSPQITSIDELPESLVLVSGKKQPYELQESAREEIAILQDSANKGEYLILQTKTASMGTVLTQKNILTSQNLVVKTQYAVSAVIKSLYSNKDEFVITHDKGVLEKEFEELIRSAVNEGVTDIHIENRQKKTRVRFRIHGLLDVHDTWDSQYGRELCGVMYNVISKEKDLSYNENKPQSAIITYSVDGHRYRIRLQTVNCYPGPNDVILRILPMGEKAEIKSLTKLGYHKIQIKEIQRASSRPRGLIAICGTTGSGKSTTLVTLMSSRVIENEGRIKAFTIEDPVEYEIQDVSQVSVVRSKDEGVNDDSDQYSEFIRTVLRGDPDVVMVGEVRDRRAASALTRIVLSGHQCFTTVHAGTPFNIITRFAEMEVSENTMVGPSYFSCLMYQVLLPTLCPHCAFSFKEYSASGMLSNKIEHVERVREFLGHKIDKIKARNPGGCNECRNRGTSGVTVAAQTVTPNSEMYELLKTDSLVDAERLWRENGGITVLQHGINKIIAGQVDPIHVEHLIDLLDTEELHEINK